MADYLKAEHLIKLIESRIDYQSKYNLTERIEAYEDALDMIKYLSPTDVEEVTRCKDCWNAEDVDGVLYCNYFNHNVYEDDFCSNGG